MAYEVTMPRLGWTSEEGIFGEWLKQDGEAVQPGDLIFTVEGDKATQEVESFEGGILRLPVNPPKYGDIIPVGAVLAYIVQAGEKVPDQVGVAPATEQTDAEQPQPSRDTGEFVARREGERRAISPRARRVARELGVDWQQITGSGRTGRIVERDIRAAVAQAPSDGAVRATPVARRVAEEANIDLASLVPRKPGGRIHRQDVEEAIATRQDVPISSSTDALAEGDWIPHSRIRQITAQRMAESVHTAAAVTLHSEADATELVNLRQRLKQANAPRGLPVPGYNDLLMKLTAVALGEHPTLNATWQEAGLLCQSGIHLGLAVDTEQGLLVPVVRDVQNKSLRQLARESAALIQQAQQQRLSSAQIQGGTFTLTNLGMYGIDHFTPIINLPQVAILGIGRILPKPVIHQGAVAAREMVSLSLTFDHRAVDGGPAARFLNTVRSYIEDPILWLSA
jgi:pyruvate dehydrogenase E2 component (dihydrolipoamide acetyltransferase)